MQNKRHGILLTLAYILPRKRKPQLINITGNTLEDAMVKTVTFLHTYGGKILSAYYRDCDLSDTYNNGVYSHTMYLVSPFAQRTELTQDQLETFNNVNWKMVTT